MRRKNRMRKRRRRKRRRRRRRRNMRIRWTRKGRERALNIREHESEIREQINATADLLVQQGKNATKSTGNGRRRTTN